jgi:hypothetical protein
MTLKVFYVVIILLHLQCHPLLHHKDQIVLHLEQRDQQEDLADHLVQSNVLEDLKLIVLEKDQIDRPRDQFKVVLERDRLIADLERDQTTSVQREDQNEEDQPNVQMERDLLSLLVNLLKKRNQLKVNHKENYQLYQRNNSNLNCTRDQFADQHTDLHTNLVLNTKHLEDHLVLK